ncbi:MAG: hypothetical protein ACOX27_05685 [Caldicoprobacterales bacterium]|nr:hypothetical protein [Clostridiales bacterium]
MLAKKYAYYEEIFPAAEPVRRDEPNRQNVPRHREETDSQVETRQAPAAWKLTWNKAVTVGLVLICFAAACFVVFRYAVISDNHTTILALEKQLEQEILRRDNLEVELSYSRDLNTIEFSATELGMSYPAEDQIHYVNLPQDMGQEVEHADAAVGDTGQTLWSRFLGLIN